MRIKKKPSLSKITDKKMSQTMTDMFVFKQQNPILKQQRLIAPLPPIRRKLPNRSSKVLEIEPERKQTETTLGESSMMFQSMYGAKQWLKPSDYVKQIGDLNLLGEQKYVEVKSYDINLTQKFEKNIEKYSRMKEVTEKWIQVLKKALSYITSKKAASDKLIEEIKFWKLLSRKFDELQYEFNVIISQKKDERATTILAVMKRFLKTQPLFKPLLEQFLYLKQQIIKLTPSIKKLHLQLEDVVSGFIVKLEQCSNVGESISLLKRILIGFEAIGQENYLIRSRYPVIYEKVDLCITQKLLATSLYPRQLANISSVKDNYQIIDQTLSFYSHFINSLQSSQVQKQLIEKAQHTRQVLASLLQILSYFQYLYTNRQVNEFSKLFSHPLNYNIYDIQNSKQWEDYMQMVNQSMDVHHFQA